MKQSASPQQQQQQPLDGEADHPASSSDANNTTGTGTNADPNPYESTVPAAENDNAVDGNNDEEDNVLDESDELTAPSAPTKLRRRRPLLARLRSRRRQMLQQHAAKINNNNSDNNMVDAAASGRRRSLVENYYRVDTLVHSPQSTRAAAAAASSAPAASATAKNRNSSSATPMGSSLLLGGRMPRQQQQHSTNTNAHSKRVKVILPGVPRYEEDWARDSHDFFNLVILIPVTVLNVMNWNWDVLLSWNSASSSIGSSGSSSSSPPMPFWSAQTLSTALQAVQTAWTGDWFDWFFGVTAAYFIVDMLWILIVPICVKSPAVILQHHVAVLLFILIPYHHEAVRYCMGACMTVEINTWFLIARRVFNKQGFPPWTLFNSSWLSIRVKVISIFFYLTWISIRCLLYPALLIPFYQHWRDLSIKTGSWCNILLPSVPLHAAFCLLNLKWSYELLMSKLRYFRRQRLYYQQQQQRRPTNGTNGAGSNGKHRISHAPSFSDPSVSSGL